MKIEKSIIWKHKEISIGFELILEVILKENLEKFIQIFSGIRGYKEE